MDQRKPHPPTPSILFNFPKHIFRQRDVAQVNRLFSLLLCDVCKIIWQFHMQSLCICKIRTSGHGHLLMACTSPEVEQQNVAKQDIT